MVPAHWRRPLAAVACAWLALIGLFHGDWLAMAHQWWDSSTYNHILVVPVILGWLVAQRLPGLWRLQPAGWWPGLVLLGAAMMLWVLGAFAGFAQITQACAVAMLVASVLALLGPKVGWGLAFPLFYMGFLVPFGDEAVPLLQTITARLTIGLVHLTHVPASIDGVFIATP
ncbi:MAG TPA: archaeosortase/exosortase family protein, partial [Novosphingobium sp.]|nr:archaeosortase/exosortase family protein [Novosphingobium sp.]